MTYTPVEIAHIRLPKSFLGYRRATVDEALTEIRLSFEDVWRERADLADKVEQLETDVVRYKELETLLRTTLISAERASQQLVHQARREAEVAVEEARAEARQITRTALAERDRLLAESRRIRGFLTAALETLGDEAVSAEPQAPAQQPPVQPPVPTPRPSSSGQSAAA